MSHSTAALTRIVGIKDESLGIRTRSEEAIPNDSQLIPMIRVNTAVDEQEGWRRREYDGWFEARGDSFATMGTNSGSSHSRHDFSGDWTHEVIGAYYEVYNTLPRGLLESAYAGGMFAELTMRGIPTQREVPINVHYKGEPIGWYRADLVVDGRLIIELKALSRLGKPETRQLYHYLRVTEMPIGLLLNFGALAEVMRVANSEARHKWKR